MNTAIQIDGDNAWSGVNTRLPAQVLPDGIAAEALNYSFLEGRPWPRPGVARSEWGAARGINLVAAGNWNYPEGTGYSYQAVSGLVVGQQYLFVTGTGAGRGYVLSTAYGADGVLGSIPAGTVIAPGVFTAPATELVVWGRPLNGSTAVAARVYRLGHTCACARFSDPIGLDTLVLLTDDPRDDTD